MVTHLLTILDPLSLCMSQFLCSQSSFVLVLRSGIEHKPQDAGFDVGEPGNGADRSVCYLWSMVGDNLGAANLEGAVRVTEVTQSEEACTIPVLGLMFKKAFSVSVAKPNVGRGNRGRILPSPCTAFSQSLSVNSFR